MALERAVGAQQEIILAILLDFDGCTFHAKVDELFTAIRADAEAKYKAEIQRLLDKHADIKPLLTNVVDRLTDAISQKSRYTRKLSPDMFADREHYIKRAMENVKENKETQQVRIEHILKEVTEIVANTLQEKRAAFDQAVITANESLLQHLLNQIEIGHYTKVIFSVGSTRQSKMVDGYNSGIFGSCFFQLINLCQALQQRTTIPCSVDRFLLADAYGRRPAGENFTHALNEDKYDYTDFFCDQRKATILYTHCQRYATLNPKAIIHTLFIDDHDGILGSNVFFYNEHKALLPGNLQLSILQYTGGDVRAPDMQWYKDKAYSTVVQGTGIIDTNYAENVRFMVECCGLDPDRDHHLVREEFSISAEFQRGSLAPIFLANRRLSLALTLDEFFRVLHELDQCPLSAYSAAEQQQFKDALRELYTLIIKDIADQQSKAIPEKTILQSTTMMVARETMRLIHRLRDENISKSHYDDWIRSERKTDILAYERRCAQQSGMVRLPTLQIQLNMNFILAYRIGLMTSAWSLLTNVMRFMLYVATPITRSATFITKNTNYLLFKPTTLGQKVSKVANEARAFTVLDEQQLAQLTAERKAKKEAEALTQITVPKPG